jgi:hypothetical protein
MYIVMANYCSLKVAATLFVLFSAVMLKTTAAAGESADIVVRRPQYLKQQQPKEEDVGANFLATTVYVSVCNNRCYNLDFARQTDRFTNPFSILSSISPSTPILANMEHLISPFLKTKEP